MDGFDQQESKSVSIPLALFRKIEARIKGTDFSSPSSYVTYVLQEVLADDVEGKDAVPEDEELVKERLRALGYLE